MIYRDGKLGDEKSVLEVVGIVLGQYGLALSEDNVDLDVTDLEKYYFNNNGWFQVVEDNGKIVGSVGIYKIDDEECELRKMYLLEEYRGQGIGKRLIENALEKAKELGYSKITLQTNSLLKKAIPLYNKYGFKEDPEAEVCCRCDMAMLKIL